MYNSNTDSLGLILDVEVFFSLGHCSGALCVFKSMDQGQGKVSQKNTAAYTIHFSLCDSVISHARIPSVCALDVHDLFAEISFEY